VLSARDGSANWTVAPVNGAREYSAGDISLEDFSRDKAVFALNACGIILPNCHPKTSFPDSAGRGRRAWYEPVFQPLFVERSSRVIRKESDRAVFFGISMT
jgi:hypothetical protein